MEPPNADEVVASFANFTGLKAEVARAYLEAYDWKEDSAQRAWISQPKYDDDDNSLGTEENEGEDTAMPKKHVPIASASSASQATASSSSRKTTTRRGVAIIKTLQDVGESSDAGHDSENDKYAGGEKSGLAIQDPRNQGHGHGHDHGDNDDDVAELVRQAQMGHPRVGLEEPSTASHNFTGTGRTLGSDDTPSREIEDPNTLRASRLPPIVRRTLHIWEDGFSIDDGDLFSSSRPNFKNYMDMFKQGTAPAELLNVVRGQEVDANLQVHKPEKYVAKYKPFGEQGRRLGAPTPGLPDIGSSSGSKVSQPSTTVAAVDSAPPAPAVTIDDTQPVLMIRIQLGNGGRLQSQFNASHTIGHVYSYVDSQSPAVTALSRPYDLMTTFPTKVLDDKSCKLGDLPGFKKGGVIVQKWK